MSRLQVPCFTRLGLTSPWHPMCAKAKGGLQATRSGGPCGCHPQPMRGRWRWGRQPSLGAWGAAASKSQFKDAFCFVLVPPPPGGPVECPFCHFLEVIGVLGRFRPGAGGKPIVHFVFGIKRSWGDGGGGGSFQVGYTQGQIRDPSLRPHRGIGGTLNPIEREPY